MSPAPLTHPARVGCSACPGSENTALGPKKSLPSHPYSSASVGRTIGRRSLDAFSSVRGSLRGRRVLHSTTNQKFAVSTMSASAGNSPLEPPIKQRWFDSLRGKSSQIPTPSSPASMSSTLKRSRFFWSSPNQPPAGDLSPSAALQTQSFRGPLPELQIASFQSELQRMSIFGEIAERSLVDAASESKPKSRNSPPKKVVRTQNEVHTETKSEPPALVATAASSIGTQLSSPGPAASAHVNSTEKLTSKVAIASLTPDKKPLEPWRILCDLYYKGTPWQPEHKTGFPDATSALSQFALLHMLSGKRECSNTLLWTSEIQMTQLQVNQTFTVYPLIDGPKRTEIQKNYDLHWAIITFTDGPSITKNTDLCEEDEKLVMAIRNTTSMGYYVDVWTYLDDDGWAVDLVLGEAEVVRDSPRIPSVFLDPQHLERRKRYEVFLRHGVAGFFQADLELLDKLRRETLQPEWLGRKLFDNNFVQIGVGHSSNVEPAQLPQSHLRNGAGSELMGFLEHTEETIADVD